MNTDRELMQQALYALDAYRPVIVKRKGLTYSLGDKAIAALRERLAQPEQEPVAWRNAAIRVGEDLCSVGPFGYYDMTAQQWLDWALSVVTVHAPPPQRKPLTKEEIANITASVPLKLSSEFVLSIARAIEKAHGIGETT